VDDWCCFGEAEAADGGVRHFSTTIIGVAEIGAMLGAARETVQDWVTEEDEEKETSSGTGRGARKKRSGKKKKPARPKTQQRNDRFARLSC
jgi:hypothetical protein